MGKICDMAGVREHDEGFPVELCRDEKTERLVIRAFNEGGNNCTSVDLLDLVAWLQAGPQAALLQQATGGQTDGDGSSRD